MDMTLGERSILTISGYDHSRQVQESSLTGWTVVPETMHMANGKSRQYTRGYQFNDAPASTAPNRLVITSSGHTANKDVSCCLVAFLALSRQTQP